MIDTIDFFVVGIYLACVLAVGLWSGRHQHSLTEYAVVNRSFGSTIVFATMAASFIGGGFSIGLAERVFLFGIASIIGLWGFSLKEILVATIIAPRLSRFPNAISVGDIMATNFGKPGKIVTGVFGMILCAGIVGAQVGGMGYVFNVFLGIDQLWGIAIGCGIVIVYTTLSGMRGVVITDLFQFVILTIGIPLTLVFGILYVGGIDAMTAAVPADRLDIPGTDATWISVLMLVLVFALGETLVPPYVQRLCISRDAKMAARGTLFAGLFSIPFFVIAGAIGLVALAIDPTIDGNLSLPHVAATALPPIVKGLVIAAVIAIVMSSADSFLNSASIAFVNDIVNPLRRAPLSAKNGLKLARLSTLVIGLASVGFAISIASILDILIYAYTYWAPVVVVPLVATVLGWQKGPAAFLGAAGAGIVCAVVWNDVLSKPADIEGIIVGVLANLAVFTVMPAGIPASVAEAKQP
ncbi:MAG: sodium:solute symporter family protein [Pseudomonadota bacterium]